MGDKDFINGDLQYLAVVIIQQEMVYVCTLMRIMELPTINDL
jgi:hypothetical protein